MTYDEISPVMRNFMGAWMTLRAAGFSADDIYCKPARSADLGGALGLYVTLRTQGKEFNIFVGVIESEQAAGDEYNRVATAMASQRVSQADRERMLHESEAFQRKVDLFMSIMNKGIAIPDRTAN